MDEKYSYRIKAAQYWARAQTEHDLGMRAALEDLARDYSRLAEGSGSEPALTVDVQLDPDSEPKVKN
jgi:hypothetical protein